MTACGGIPARQLGKSPDRRQAIELLHQIASSTSRPTPRQADKPIAIYGAGAFGKLAKDYFDWLGIHVSLVVDANPDMHRSKWHGLNLQAPKEVPDAIKSSHLLVICVGKSSYTGVTKPLIEDGWTDVVPFYTVTAAYLDKHPLGNGWFVNPLTTIDLEGIACVLDAYDDDESRAHHLQFLAWHTLQEEWFFSDAPINTENRYFIDDVRKVLHDSECLLDLGTHRGEVCQTFLQMMSGSQPEIWAVEPDPENSVVISAWIKQLSPEQRSHVHLLSCAIGQENGEKKFIDGLDYASQFCEYGNRTVQVRSIDDLNIAPTFIKAHLEGAEMDAILGGNRTIHTYRPLVALSVYHNALGLWKCQKALMDAYRDCAYRFKFRLHAWHGSGAVFYMLNRNINFYN